MAKVLLEMKNIAESIPTINTLEQKMVKAAICMLNLSPKITLI